MTRRAIQRRTSPVSLFSFLDILGGTVGVLTLIIAVFLIQMGQGKQIVQLVSEGSQFQTRTASYIICNGGGEVEIHSAGKALATTIESQEVQDLLNELMGSDKRYLILGVRPNGFSDFKAIRTRAEEMNIPVGYEPLDDGWKIRAPGGAVL